MKYLWLALTAACLAQEAPLSTDAPTFSRTSHTVGEGVAPDLEVRLETNGLSGNAGGGGVAPHSLRNPHHPARVPVRCTEYQVI